ncbi:MAG: NADH-quinone oxidoreductase subunit L [Anaerolineaceae bacterium]|nr:NADH-quinone oxidoreductase subunit L [Anaerolineaceae bacterium]
MTIETLIWLLPLPPILAFFLIVLFTNRSKRLSHSLAISAALVSWAGSMIVFWNAIHTEGLTEHPFASAVNWLPTGNTWFRIGVQIDPLQAVTLFFVAWTVLMIFVYSVGYHNYGQPAGDHDRPGLPPEGAAIKGEHGHTHRAPSIEPMYSRFFAFISLFAFAMFTLVVTDNLLVLYIGWEIMGLCSYLLIGFWYGKASARNAAMKAFLTTRIGDVFMLLGLAFLYSATGTLNYREIFSNHVLLQQLAATSSGFLGLSVAGATGLLLFAGTVGKSAQFPLHVWLPDAMEGPTPVSAMIHAATMVSAGVYLAIRIYPLVSAGWLIGQPINPAMTLMAFTGTFTAMFAATIAVGQKDIKRVLAYSTISQLGYMIAALGVGAYVAAAFHLVTHAFFKALLFLGSGSVIHGMEHGAMHMGEHLDAQDMFNMGGLRHKMPLTFWTFLIGGLALSGFPLVTAGFWSKDEILAGAFSTGHIVVFIALGLSALFTAFYTMRQITLTFLGEPRSQAAAHAAENRWTMTFPLVILAIFAIVAGWTGIPHNFPLFGGIVPNWFEEFVGSMLVKAEAPLVAGFPWIPFITSVVVALGGLYLGWLIYRNHPAGKKDPLESALGKFYGVLREKYFFDQAYDFLFVRTSHWLADVFTAKWVDRGVIDGFLHGIARGALGIGTGLRRYFDLPVVNGAGDTLGSGVRRFGVSLKVIQSGRVQQYLIAGITLVVTIGILFYYLLVLA